MISAILGRALMVSSTLVLCGFALDRASRSEPIPPRAPLAELPMQLGPWNGVKAENIEPSILAVLGVDEYVNRLYRSNTDPIVGLYIGYYQTQRQGSSMHSPLNCLPGSGWQPISNGRSTISLDSGPIEVNRYVVQKGGQSTLVLYWYQSHGRVVASEYWGKFYMVTDAVRLNRTDAALVRVIVPIAGTDKSAENQAERVGLDFVLNMFPSLSRHLPA